MLGFNGKLLDFIYPVGSYYETSNTSFNPNTAWGGTWLEDTKGRVTVALDSNDTDFDTIGETGGSKYLQEHSHNLTLVKSRTFPLNGGAGDQAGPSGFSGDNNGIMTNTSGIQNAGTGDSGNLQPYLVVKRWHRTA